VTIPQEQAQNLKIWEKITIIVGEEETVGIYHSRVEDFCAEGVFITNPTMIGGDTLLRNNLLVSVQIIREDAAYEFQSVIGRIEQNNKSRVALTSLTALRRVQQRLFVRLELRSPATYAFLSQLIGRSNIEQSLKWEQAELLDISGGGALLTVNENTEPNVLLLFQSVLFKELGMPECIVALARRCASQQKQLVLGVEFIIAEELSSFLNNDTLDQLPSSCRRFDHVIQNKLVNYVFQQQVKLRQKGLL